MGRDIGGVNLDAFAGIVGNGSKDAPDMRVVVWKRLGSDFGGCRRHESPRVWCLLWGGFM